MTPSRGAAGILDTSDASLSIACASGATGDLYREVEYSLPSGYQTFTAGATTAGDVLSETLTKVEVIVARSEAPVPERFSVASEVMTLGEHKTLTADLTPGIANEPTDRLTLRITCQSAQVRVDLTDAVLTS